MIATARPNRTRQIRRRELDQFRRSIESWERHGKEAGRDGDAELAAAYAEDVADLRAILRLIETGALHKAAEAIDRLDTFRPSRSPPAFTMPRYRAVDALDALAQPSRSA